QLTSALARTEKGENSLTEPFVQGPPPPPSTSFEGVVEKTREIEGGLRWWPTGGIDVAATLGYRWTDGADHVAGARVHDPRAAIAGIYSVGARVTNTLGVNLLGTVSVLEAAVAAGVGRVIEFSTSEVYGPFVYRGKESDQLSIGPTGEPRWTYAISKLAGEFFSYAYAADHGLQVVTLRPFNVYGPRQVGEGAVQQIVHRALQGEDITVFNDGTQVRSWCYVDD